MAQNKTKSVDSGWERYDQGIREANMQWAEEQWGKAPPAACPTSPTTADGGGLRYNGGKPRFDLLPPEALIALADHFRKGSEKYAARNWERSGPWCEKTYSSLERHCAAWLSGEDHDPENGSHHMIAVAWNAIALYTYHIRGIGTDDRPSGAVAYTDVLNILKIEEDRARATNRE